MKTSEFMIDQRNAFQRNLKTIRTQFGWSTKDLADLIGMTRQNIWLIETQKQGLSLVVYYAILYVISQHQTV